MPTKKTKALIRAQHKFKAKRQKLGKGVEKAIPYSKIPLGVPQSMMTRLIYTKTFNLTGTAAASAQVFRLNNIFAIDHTGDSDQPMFFDQYALLYYKYRVYKTFYELKIINRHVTEAARFIAYVDLEQTTQTMTEAAERKSAIIKLIPIASAGQQVVIKNKISVKNYIGRNTNSDNELAALVTEDPIKQVFLHLLVNDILQNPESEYNIAVQVRMIFTTRFNSSRSQASS